MNASEGRAWTLSRIFEKRAMGHFMFLLTIALIWGLPFPFGNEGDHLAMTKKFFDKLFLSEDWTFASISPDRYLFNLIIGAFGFVLSPALLGWLGRIACWVAASIALFRITDRLAIARHLATLALVVFALLTSPAAIGGEWVVGTFEAKSVAWVLFLFALDSALAKAWLRSGVLTGLCVSMNPTVGIVGGFALLCAALATHRPLSELVKPALIGLAFSIPGLVQAVYMVLEIFTNSSPDDWTYLSLTVLYRAFDLNTFSLLELATLFVMFILTLFITWRLGGPFRLLFFFIIFLVPAFAIGFVAHSTGEMRLLAIMPFRHLPLMTLLIFLLATSAIHQVRGPAESRRLEKFLVGAFIVSVKLFVLVCLVDVIAKQRLEFRGGWLDMYPAIGILLSTIGLVVIPRSQHPLIGRFAWAVVLLIVTKLVSFICGTNEYQMPLPTHFGIRFYEAWTKPSDDLDELLTSLKQASLPREVVVLPPTVADATFKLERSQFIHYYFPRFDKLGEWRRRAETIAGPPPPGGIGAASYSDPFAPYAFYYSLKPEDVLKLRAEFGATIFVSEQMMPFPIFFDARTFKAFRIPGAENKP